MNFRQIAFGDHRNVFFTTLAAGTSAFAFSPTSTIFPVILTLSTLLVYSPFLFRKGPNTHSTRNIIFLLCALSVGSSAFRLRPSLEALSTPGGSLAALFISSATLASLTTTTLYISTKLSTRLDSSAAQLTIFPALWATLWCTISHLSPVGRLSTWSIANNLDAYNWMSAFVGPASKDWIVAAWAVVISQTVGCWYMGPKEEEDSIDLFNPRLERLNIEKKSNNTIAAPAALAAILTLLTIPSFILPDLPLPVSTIDTVTPLSVACILPTYNHIKHHIPNLQDYIAESIAAANKARVILWPEGAVTFDSVTQREEAFAEIRQKVRGPYVGVSFEETIADPSDPSGIKHFTRTGLALIDQNSNDTYLTYYKRHLVPVAESYRLKHSSLEPTLFEAQVHKPNDVSKTQWGRRPLLLTSSICLDFATPSPFSALDSRPGLILAPARTWDRAVGHAMWLQARQRAEELNSMVLWCDGGEGGVSGIAGGGFNEVTQVGSGTFVQTIGLQYPFDSRRAVYARFGDSILILFWIFVVGQNLFPRALVGRFKVARSNLLDLRRRYIGQRQARIEQVEEADLLS